MPSLADPHVWASFATLTVLEVVLGVDNLVFLALLSGRLPARLQARARRLGLALALVARLALLWSIVWLAHLTAPVFFLAGHGVSWRDLILIGGGAFLLFKATHEIHLRLDRAGDHAAGARNRATFLGTIAQIVLLDLVFSLDSVITAVGIATEFWVMAAAIVVAVAVMLAASGRLTAFIARHASVKMLALAFLLLIGMVLVADGAGFHVPRGYIYVAMAFSSLVEALNLLASRRRGPPRRSLKSAKHLGYKTTPQPLSRRASMSGEFLGDRRAALEEAFFARHDAELRQRLRALDEAKAKKAALAAASGITDDAVLERLEALGIEADTVAALSVVPLVAVAWADGHIDDHERRSAFARAAETGVVDHTASLKLLEKWLAHPPSPSLLEAWKSYVRALSASQNPEGRHALKEGVMTRARAVAHAAGGFLGLGQKVSASEAKVLAELEQAFSE